MNTVPPASLPQIEPGPDRPGVIRFLRSMVANPAGATPRSAYREPVTTLSVAGSQITFVCDPDLLEEILIKRAAEFPKSVISDRVLRPVFGNSLLTAHGEDWRWKRRLSAPHFAPLALQRYLPDMVMPFHKLADAWCVGQSDEPVDVSSAMTAATFDVINEVVFSQQEGFDFGVVSKAIENYLEPVTWVVTYASLKIPAWVPRPGMGQMRRARDAAISQLSGLVASRRQSPGGFADIAADLIDAEDPQSGKLLTDEDLTEMLATLVVAGHETSANGLTWSLLCLALMPDLQVELAAEVARTIGTRTIEPADLPKLETVEAFVKETLRLFPPVPQMSRRATRDEVFGDQTVPAGSEIFVPIYALHRHSALWDRPDTFDHTRFLGEKGRAVGRTAFMPFGAGPRICIGASFALTEMVAGLATLLQRVRFAPVAGARYEMVHRITLKPRYGLPLRVLPVNAAGRELPARSD